MFKRLRVRRIKMKIAAQEAVTELVRGYAVGSENSYYADRHIREFRELCELKASLQYLLGK